MDFPVPLGTSGCPAQLQVHDQSNAPVRTTRRPHALRRGLPLEVGAPGFRRTRLRLPDDHRRATLLRLARVAPREPRRAVPAGRSGCPNRPSTAGLPGLRPPLIRWRAESSTVHVEHRARGWRKICFKIFASALHRPCGRPVDGPGEHLWTRLRRAQRPVQSALAAPVEDRDPIGENAARAVSHPGHARSHGSRQLLDRRSSTVGLTSTTSLGRRADALGRPRAGPRGRPVGRTRR